ncbi:SAM-dependent methyltransferase [Fructilactobacillus lindneri]|uniref:SAM-dependent methyltransferase n=2 Tax=Fructilactobacillus lindneri TaxID=53444 RepID=A0AB33BN60_9LACO|nr:class I SAM-dependent methyltransferase [Fructilactobacillus lindneri]ANZ58260.1 SAM-dependent methyltransferase [Fructilactobacillus lindneri]ANZ59582.1 SAM-dependent methyltransferase [Fructilactobacillus lindneri]KRN79087.1 putative methyltransferase (putative) [Fructilactobacillus lindneri DSM 20690 = JCM 11027]POG98634.1 SAM-dependent methyltransferase [Fructilactobacillus lindneri]POH04022.1 SAM-dependent methyltransferase [Fructilactobacillus lindneri]
MIYSKFATFYDELFDNQLYKRWFSFVANNVKSDASLLDLACGTGRLLVILKQEHYQVVGADLSDDMLTIAQMHLSEKDFFDTELIQANMLDLNGLTNFDDIMCFDDSICYLNNIDEVQEMFSQVHEHLNKGGKFLFDVITPYQTDIKYPGYMYNFHDQDHAFMWTTYTGEQIHSVEHDLSFFEYNEKINAYDEYSETHKERTYELTEYKNALKLAGFNNIKVTSDFGEQKIDDKTTRWFFVCEKV